MGRRISSTSRSNTACTSSPRFWRTAISRLGSRRWRSSAWGDEEGMMAASNDTTGSAPIQDARSAPRGVLPRQLQMWLMIGLAVIILAIILFTGHSSPVPRASAATRVPEPSLMAPDRIQSYQRQLVDDEARLRRELAKAPAPASGSAPPAANRVGETSQSDPIADGQRRRDYQSLFADNIALSRPPAEAPSYSERATAARPPTSATAPAAMSPQELVLLQALVSQRAAVSPPSTPAAASASDSLTPNAQAARVETPTA